MFELKSMTINTVSKNISGVDFVNEYGMDQ